MTAPAAAPAAGTSTLTVAMSARAIQLAIAARAMQDAVRLWPLLDPKRLDATFPAWLRAMILMTRNYRGQSAQAAASAYRVARQHATQSPAPQSLIRFAPPLGDEWMTRAFGYSGPGLLTRDEVRPGTALSTTLGTTARIAQDGGRTTIQDTVKADPVALGYYRVTDGNPCAWCALMASRGIVYKNEMQAGRAANKRFVGDGEFKYHNMCGCDAAPAFTHDHELPEISRKAAEVYRNRGKGPALAAFRTAWDEHLAASAPTP